MAEAQRQFPGCVSARVKYDRAVEHQMMAGCDIITMPSRLAKTVDQIIACGKQRRAAPEWVMHTRHVGHMICKSRPRPLQN